MAVSLGVDGEDHDEVHIQSGTVRDQAELLTFAIDTLVAARDGVLRVKDA